MNDESFTSDGVKAGSCLISYKGEPYWVPHIIIEEIDKKLELYRNSLWDEYFEEKRCR